MNQMMKLPDLESFPKFDESDHVQIINGAYVGHPHPGLVLWCGQEICVVLVMGAELAISVHDAELWGGVPC